MNTIVRRPSGIPSPLGRGQGEGSVRSDEAPSPRPSPGGRGRKSGFTLFELILAIALSATLLALVGTAINLYLGRVDAGRMRVEEAQLARSILAMIADDIRATAIYQPQDTKAIAQLMEAGTPFDVDSIDATQPTGAGADTNSPGASAGLAGGSGSSATGGTMSTGSSTSSSSGQPDPEENTMPLGLSGTFSDIYIDAARLPRRDELFGTITGYTNAPLPTTGSTSTAVSSAVVPPADVKTIRYFIRPGEQIAAGSIGATSLDPAAEQRAGGLVRQEVPRTLRLWAEQTGNSAILDGGQKLIAPEVVQIEFRYYDGTQVVDIWDMAEQQGLPRAVEVRIWLAPPEQSAALDDTQYDAMNRIQSARLYRQTVYLPMAELAAPQQSSGSGTDEETESDSSEIGTGSSFDNADTGSNGSGSSSGFTQ